MIMYLKIDGCKMTLPFGMVNFLGGGLLYYPWRTKDELPTGHRLVIPDVSTVTEVTPVTGTVPVPRRFNGKGYEAITRGWNSDHEVAKWPPTKIVK